MSTCQLQDEPNQLSVSSEPTVASPDHETPEKVESANHKLVGETRSDPDSSPISVLAHPWSASITKDSLLTASRPRSSSSSDENRENIPSPSQTGRVLRSAYHHIAYGTDTVSRPPLASKPQDNKLMSLRPKVVMGDDGAEVTLEPTSTPSRTTQRNALTDQTNLMPQVFTPDLSDNRKLPTNSLLDFDTSPSPIPEKTQRSKSLGSQMLCGASGMGCLPEETESSALVQAPQQNVERTIQMLLGNPMGLEGWCHGWQAWLYFGMEQGENTDESTCETKEDMKRLLRNRAFDLNARSRRIRVLKEDLSPFDSSPERIDAPFPLSKTRSFSVCENATRKPDHHRSSTTPDVPSNITSFGCYWDPYGCGQADSDSPAIIRFRHFGSADEDLCYDSDPEEITRRRSRHVASKSDDNESFLSFTGTDGLIPSNKSRADRQRNLGRPRRLDVDFDNDRHVKDIVQEFMNERFTLVWHRSVKPYTLSKGTPQAMKAWIERGQQLQAGIIQPKFVWRPVQDYENESQRLGLSTPSLESVELLDISRVLEVNRIDRKLYPLAKRKNCFLLETLDRKMMFEARCESERDRIVHSLKLLVARFGSKVIVRDQAVLDEFFTSFEKAVPGEAPRWTHQSKTLSLL